MSDDLPARLLALMLMLESVAPSPAQALREAADEIERLRRVIMSAYYCPNLEETEAILEAELIQ